MKDKIFSAAKTRFANLGLGDDILESVASYLAASVNEESGIDAALTGVEPMMKSWQKSADKIRTDSTKVKKNQAVSNEQKPTPITEEPTPQPATASEEIMPAWAKALTDSIQSVANEVQRMKGEKITADRKQVFDGLIQNLPESLKKSYGFINYSDLSDDEFSKLTSSVKENVENVTKEIGIKGGIFKTPYESRKPDNKGRSEKEVKNLVAEMFNSKN